MTLTLGSLFDRVTAMSQLDPAGQLTARLGRGTPRRASSAAADLVGHPVHPLLTDLPIGFWTSAWILDLLPQRRQFAPASQVLVALGVISTVPTILTGLGDASELDQRRRRLAAVHGTLNLLATAAFARSWWLRRTGRFGRGVALTQIGAVLATAAGAAGGHLVFSGD